MWAPNYVSFGDPTDDLGNYFGLDPSDLRWVTTIERLVTTASRSIDRSCNRQFGQVAAAESRYYTARVDRETGRYVVPIDDLQDPTGLLVAADTSGDLSYSTQYTGYRLAPLNAAVKGKPYEAIILAAGTVPPMGEGAIRVTGLFGWTAIPATIRSATLLQVARLFARKDAPFGISGSPQMQGELRLLDKLDPDVAVMVRDFKRNWVAA